MRLGHLSGSVAVVCILMALLPMRAGAIDPNARSAEPVPRCPFFYWGKNPVLESSRLRIVLAHPAAVAERFVAFSAMSALVYGGESRRCEREKPDADVEKRFAAVLGVRGWRELQEFTPACQDDTGLYYRVWLREREQADGREVAIAFRGTEAPDAGDWKANLHWFTRARDDQYRRASEAARRVVAMISTRYEGDVSFFVTGHSLGGGLAQHVLYDQPEQFRQAVAFNPSPVVATEEMESSNTAKACECLDELGVEARIYRIYERGEVLDHVRRALRSHTYPTPLERNVHAIAFRFVSGDPFTQHGIDALTVNLSDLASSRDASVVSPWYEGEPDWLGQSCTVELEQRQAEACAERSGSCPD